MNSIRRLCLTGLALLSAPAFSGEAITYYHNDMLGSPVVATDASGYVRWSADYRPYGSRDQGITDQLASADNSRWYTDHVHDEETSLTYMGARHYDPELGRFMSVDPVGFLDDNFATFNRFAYANNNPYTFIDPDGRSALTKLIKQTIKRRGNVIEAVIDVGDTTFTIIAPTSTPIERLVAVVEIVSPVSVSDVKDAKNIISALRKRWGGRRGNLDTRATNQAYDDRIVANGGEPTAGFFDRGKESYFPPDGPTRTTKGGRYSDGTALDANKDKFEFQSVTTNKDGIPLDTELEAGRDIAVRSDSPVILAPKVTPE